MFSKSTGVTRLAVDEQQVLSGPPIKEPTMWLHHYAQGNPGDPVEPAAEEPRKIFKVPKYRLEWLDGKLASLNKVAAKLNLDPVGYKVLREWAEADPEDELGVRQLQFAEIELFGETPQLKTPSGDTYKFLSRIMHSTEGNIIKSIPGVELPDSFRTVEPRCQHCNYNRRRKDTYVLQDTNAGTMVQVGSTCLKDFLGHQSANSYASWAEAFADIGIALMADDDGEGGFGGGGGQPAYGIERFLEMVYAYTKMFGWIGRTKARETGDMSSVDGALSLYHARDEKSKALYQQMMDALNAEDKDMLIAALEWARELKDGQSDDIDNLSDYYWNLSIACSGPVVQKSTEGIVASLPVAYNKAVLSKIQPNPTTVAGDKGQLWVGRGVLQDENIYGDENSYRMTTEDNKIIQWSGSPIEQVVGGTVNVEGTIVGYSRYFTSVTTRLARVKILSDEEYGQKKTENVAPVDLGDQPEYVPGEKITVDVAILSTQNINSDWGSSTLYMMTDNWGNTLKWFNSGQISFDQGERLNITGTIKKIDEYKGQPQVLLTRCKVNSRELPEGQEDPRLSPIEEKQVKSQLSKLKRQLKKTQVTVGVTDQNDLNQQAQQVMQPIQQYISDIRYSVPQDQVRLLDYQNLIQNYATVGDLIATHYPVAIQKAEEHQAQIEQERPDSYEVTSNRSNIERLKGRHSLIPQAAAEFSQLAADYVQRKQAFDQNKPAMDGLSSQIDELENKVYEHRNAVKTWGKRLAFNWLGKLLLGSEDY